MMAIKINPQSMLLTELLCDIVDVTSLKPCAVTGLALDSRDIQTGFIFVALQGATEHGIEFAQTAIDNGAVVILNDVRDKDGVISLAAMRSSVPVISVENLNQHLAQLIRRFYGNATNKLNIIGVTGTNGKTTCSQYIAQALNFSQSTAVMGTLGNGFLGGLIKARHTTADNISLHRLLNEYSKNGAENVVMEVSSHGIDQGRVSDVNFNVAMFTNLTQDHLDYHSTMSEYGAAKRKLFDLYQPSIAVINIDDQFGAELISSLPNTVRTVSYSLSKQRELQQFVCATSIEQSKQGMTISIDSSWGAAEFKTSLLGRFNASNLLGVLAVLLTLDFSVSNAVSRLAKFTAIAGRMETIEVDDQPLVVIDYAHTPDALLNVLQAVREHTGSSQDSAGQIWCVFGCGGDRDKTKRAKMGLVAQQYSEYIVLTDDNPRTQSASCIVDDILEGISDDMNCVVIHDRQEAIRHALQRAKSNDIVVIAGKGHEEYQVIGKQKIPYPADMSIALDIFHLNSIDGDKS